MSQRNFYVVDGEYREAKTPADRHRFARLVSPAFVAFTARGASSRIPPQYFVATAERETDFAYNEVDVEDSGFTSKGLYQVSDGYHLLTVISPHPTEDRYHEGEDETTQAGMPGADLCDPVVATLVFAKLQEQRLDAILTHVPMVEPDVWAYLGLAHNEGLGLFAPRTEENKHGVLVSLYEHGQRMDWPGFIERNRGTEYGDRAIRYGSAMISGGSKWAEALRRAELGK